MITFFKPKQKVPEWLELIVANGEVINNQTDRVFIGGYSFVIHHKNHYDWVRICGRSIFELHDIKTDNLYVFGQSPYGEKGGVVLHMSLWRFIFYYIPKFIWGDINDPV